MRKSRILLSSLLLTSLAFLSCSDDDGTPITMGDQVTVTNTFQSTSFTNDAELPIEDLFQQAVGSLAATSEVSSAVEFPAYLLNLYDIDIDESSIKFTVVAEDDDPNYGELFRVLEPDTFDRYYFTFTSEQNVDGFTASNEAVNLRLDSKSILVVEIGEGYDFKPGQNFTISLN